MCVVMVWLLWFDCLWVGVLLACLWVGLRLLFWFSFVGVCLILC